MLYIRQTMCISPQSSFPEPRLDVLQPSVDSKLKVIEPIYEGLPPNAARRMTKAVRIGAGAALPLLRQGAEVPAAGSFRDIHGIIIGTGNAGMEQSIQFVQQIIDHNEGVLAPGDFVQSTPNTIGSQISALTSNKRYNITHVHGGLAFENALLDAAMRLREHPQDTYLLGGVDEIGAFNYNIDLLEGWYKKGSMSNDHLYETDTPGSIVGEGAAMFLAGSEPGGSLAQVRAVSSLHSDDPIEVAERLRWFVGAHLPPGASIDLLLSGENGDCRLLPYYLACENVLPANVPVARFKHMSGEYPTASAFALWLACRLPVGSALPGHMIKQRPAAPHEKLGRTILIYNTHKGNQHSFMLVVK